MTEVFRPLSHYQVVWAVRVLARVSCSPWWDPISLQGPLLSQLLFHSHNQGTFFFSSSLLQTTWAVSQHEGAVSSPWSKLLLNKFFNSPNLAGYPRPLFPVTPHCPPALSPKGSSNLPLYSSAGCIIVHVWLSAFHFLCKQSFYQI